MGAWSAPSLFLSAFLTLRGYPPSQLDVTRKHLVIVDSLGSFWRFYSTSISKRGKLSKNQFNWWVLGLNATQLVGASQWRQDCWIRTLVKRIGSLSLYRYCVWVTILFVRLHCDSLCYVYLSIYIAYCCIYLVQIMLIVISPSWAIFLLTRTFGNLTRTFGPRLEVLDLYWSIANKFRIGEIKVFPWHTSYTSVMLRTYSHAVPLRILNLRDIVLNHSFSSRLRVCS